MKHKNDDKALKKEGLQMTLTEQIRTDRKPVGRKPSVRIAFETSAEPKPLDTVLGMLLEAYAKQKPKERVQSE